MNNEPSWTEQDLRRALDRYERELRESGKARNTINTYVQHPERFINWLVGRYEPNPTAAKRVNVLGASTTRRSRYDPLREHLTDRTEPIIRMTFPEIEAVLGAPLPRSAREHRAWWANEQGGSHVHARAWLGAGRRTANVDLNVGIVELIR